MFLRSKVSFVRKEIRQSEVSAGENEDSTPFLLAKVRISRLKVWSLRLLARVKPDGERP